MSVVLVILAIACSPIILAPIIIPLARRAQARIFAGRLLKVCPPSIYIDSRHQCCGSSGLAGTMVECEGEIYGLGEVFGDEKGRVGYDLALFCPLCGYLKKVCERSLLIGKPYEKADNVCALYESLRPKRTLDRWTREIESMRNWPSKSL